MHRQEQRLVGFEKDPYKASGKPRGVTRCTDCSAVFHRGRWTWRATPAVAAAGLCPACRRVREGLPAGFVRLSGEFVRAHKDEVVGRVRHCEEAERRDHPLQRVIAVKVQGAGMLVTTTDAHLARRIGEALQRAYKGELQYRYNKDETILRVTWSR